MLVTYAAQQQQNGGRL